jgi:hypothetical protein
MVELLWALAELLIELGAELGLGILGSYAGDGRRGLLGPVLMGLVGAGVGLTSVALFPRPVIQSLTLGLLNVALAPLAVAVVVGALRKRRWTHQPFRYDLERFGAAYCATLGFVLVRFGGQLLSGA